MLRRMRTTIRLDDDLLREAKAYAAATDRTLTRLIEDALREALARRQAATAASARPASYRRGRAVCSPVSTSTTAPLSGT